MCGIVAAFGDWARAETCHAGLRSLAHRGPDKEADWSSTSGRAWLGHRRLAIVDLSPAGDQPMRNEDGSLWLTCNGEIYNAPELRARLQGLGHVFGSTSDNEVILHGYEQWGDAVLDHLEGMFAFALWDERAQRVLAARDRVGIKPLYYGGDGKNLAVASQPRAILGLGLFERAVDPSALAHVLTIGYVPPPRSIWRGISKLGPGQLLTWDGEQGARVTTYWSPPETLDGAADPKAWMQLQRDVVGGHLLSDVPIGVFLSGGLDSSSIAAQFVELDPELARQSRAFTLSFPGNPLDELAVAEACAAHLGLAQQSVPLEADDLAARLDAVSAHFDEPQGYSALMTMDHISAAAAEHYKVILSGDGGDEVFGGYNWYRDLEPGLDGQAAERPRAGPAATPEERVAVSEAFAGGSVLHRHAHRLFPRFLPEEAEAILAPMGLAFTDADMLAPFEAHYRDTLPPKRALQRVDLMTFCSASILPKVDLASMAYSLEVRVPLLDRRIVEWGLSRAESEAERREPKHLLRSYLSERVRRGWFRTVQRVPNAVLEHEKRGFSLRTRFPQTSEDMIGEIEDGVWVRQGLWAPAWRDAVATGVPYRDARLWILKSLSRWAEHWLQ